MINGIEINFKLSKTNEFKYIRTQVKKTFDAIKAARPGTPEILYDVSF